MGAKEDMFRTNTKPVIAPVAEFLILRNCPMSNLPGIAVGSKAFDNVLGSYSKAPVPSSSTSAYPIPTVVCFVHLCPESNSYRFRVKGVHTVILRQRGTTGKGQFSPTRTRGFFSTAAAICPFSRSTLRTIESIVLGTMRW